MNGDAWAWAYAAIPLAYEAGRAAGVAALAEALAEVDAARALVPVDRRVRSWEEQVAERAALFERCAAAEHERRGSRPWPGIASGGPPTEARAEVYRQLLATWDRPTGRETRHGRASDGSARP